MHYMPSRRGVPYSNNTPVTPPSGPNVLKASDFTYLGQATVPADDQSNGIRFAYSAGAMTGRVVGGDIHLLMCGAQYETGWPDPVYEIKYNGVGSVCTLVTNWWDVTNGQRVAQPSAQGLPIRGLLFDPESGQLFWTYQDQYNVVGDWNPSVGTSTLTTPGGVPTVTAFGPWRTAEFSGFTAGYLLSVPAFYQSVLGGHLACGAPIGSGNAGSPWGVYCSAFTAPANTTPADGFRDGHVTIGTSNIIYSDISNKQPRANDYDDCGWTHYGESDTGGNEPQKNPTQNGSGCTVLGQLCGASFGPGSVFNFMDTVGASVWINGSIKQGVVYIGQLAKTVASQSALYGTYGRNHVWYGPGQGANIGISKMCAHGITDSQYGNTAVGPGTATMQSAMWIYDPADLVASALGFKSRVLLPPATDAALLTNLAYVGAPMPELTPTWFNHAGVYFEPISKLLFLSSRQRDWTGEGHRPVVDVFSVNC